MAIDILDGLPRLGSGGHVGKHDVGKHDVGKHDVGKHDVVKEICGCSHVVVNHDRTPESMLAEANSTLETAKKLAEDLKVSADRAKEKAEAADASAKNADRATSAVNAAVSMATTNGDYAKSQGDYAKAKGELAESSASNADNAAAGAMAAKESADNAAAGAESATADATAATTAANAAAGAATSAAASVTSATAAAASATSSANSAAASANLAAQKINYFADHAVVGTELEGDIEDIDAQYLERLSKVEVKASEIAGLKRKTEQVSAVPMEYSTDAIEIKNDDGEVVHKIDETDADFTGLKCGGVDVLTKVDGKGLSANDYTDAEKAKVEKVSKHVEERNTSSETKILSVLNDDNEEVLSLGKDGCLSVGDVLVTVDGQQKSVKDVSSGMSVAPRINNPSVDWSKSTLKILCIGNSFMMDMLAYVNGLVGGAGLSLDNVVCLFMIRAGGGYRDWYNQWHDKDVKQSSIRYVFGKSTNNCKEWATIRSASSAMIDGTNYYNGGRFRAAIKDCKWDVIVLAQGRHGDAEDWFGKTEGGYFREFIRLIKAYQPQAHIAMEYICSDPGESIESGDWSQTQTLWAKRNEQMKWFQNEFGISTIIPVCTAVENLRMTSLNVRPSTGVDGTNNFSRDNFHLGTGLARYVAACAFFQTIIGAITGKSVLGNNYRIAASEDTQEATYANACVDVTDANAKIAQLCAVMACGDMYCLQNAENLSNEIIV